ncbi:MAG: ABC transporter permease [Myxococcaceae bacterium]
MSAFRVLLRKELVDVVRDRRTLLLTIALPVFLYPVLLMVMGAIIAAGTQRLKNEPLTVAVVGEPTLGLLNRALSPPKTTFVLHTRAEAEALLKDQKIAAAVQAPDDVDALLVGGRQAVVTVLYTKRFDRSMEALERLRPMLDTVNASTLKVRLDELHLEPGFVQPVKADPVDLDFQKDLGPLIASRLLPLVLLMMLMVGAMYPAVDLTAGEKERGTLETLLVAAVRPVDVMAAKYATVGLVAIVSALANLAAMGVTFGLGLSLGPQTTTFHLTAGQVGIMLVCLVPSALLLSGIALAVASTARNFKEGQALMTPLVLVCLAPALVSQMPGIELTTVTALVPLLNVALLIKAAVLGTVTPVQVGLTVGSISLFALVALKLAASAFNSEAFRFSGTGGWAALFGPSKQSDRR